MKVSNNIINEDINKVVSADLPWEYFYGKTVLITGANGFLPAYMLRTLLLINESKKGAPVKIIAAVRNKDKATRQFGDINAIENTSFIIQNIADPLIIEEDVHVIIHAASQASPKYYATDPVGTLSANTIGTYNLLKLAVEKKAEKFLYFSSSEVYGKLDDGSAIAETMYGSIDPLDIRSCYAESKRMGENMCVSFAKQYDLPVYIVRPFHTYGPGLSLDDGRVFADFVSNIINNHDIVMNSDGSAVRSFCYLADAVAGFFTVLLKGESSQAYNIGNPEGASSIKSLAETLVNLYPEKKLKAICNVHKQSGYLQSTFNILCPDITKIKAIGWQPVTGIPEGFKRTIDSFIN